MYYSARMPSLFYRLENWACSRPLRTAQSKIKESEYILVLLGLETSSFFQTKGKWKKRSFDLYVSPVANTCEVCLTPPSPGWARWIWTAERPWRGGSAGVQRETEGEGGTTDVRARQRRNGVIGHPVCPKLRGFLKPGRSRAHWNAGSLSGAGGTGRSGSCGGTKQVKG